MRKKLHTLPLLILSLFFICVFFNQTGVYATSTPEAIVLPGNGVSANGGSDQSGAQGFTYKTLVNIPGLGTDGVVTINPSSLGLYLQIIFNYIIGIAIALAVVMIIYGGVIYSTTDALGKKGEGKTIITDALYGLALALGSFLILNTINPDLLKFDLNLPTVAKVDLETGGLAEVRRDQLQVLTDLQSGVSAGSAADGSNLLVVSGESALGWRARAIAIGAEKGLNGKLFACQVSRESRFNINTNSSSKGAIGLAQILPETGASVCGLSVSELRDGNKNLSCGATIMSKSSSKNPRYIDALAEYNGGPSALEPSKDCPGKKRWECEWDNPAHTIRNTGYQETRNYVSSISACARANAVTI